MVLVLRLSRAIQAASLRLFRSGKFKSDVEKPADCHQLMRQQGRLQWMSDAKQKDHEAVACDGWNCVVCGIDLARWLLSSTGR